MARTMDNMTFQGEEFNTWLNSTDYTGPVGVIVKLYVKEELREPFLKGMEAKMASIKNEEGVLVYKLNEDVTDSVVFWLTEEWRSVEDLKTHCNSEAYKASGARMGAVLQEGTGCQLAIYKLCSSPALSI